MNDIYIQLGLNRGRSKWEDELIDKLEAAQRDAGVCPEQSVRNILMPGSPFAQQIDMQLAAMQPALGPMDESGGI